MKILGAGKFREITGAVKQYKKVCTWGAWLGVRGLSTIHTAFCEEDVWI